MKGKKKKKKIQHFVGATQRDKIELKKIETESDSASLESNIEEEEATVPTASSQSKTVSCSKVVRHKTRLKV